MGKCTNALKTARFRAPTCDFVRLTSHRVQACEYTSRLPTWSCTLSTALRYKAVINKACRSGIGAVGKARMWEKLRDPMKGHCDCRDGCRCGRLAWVPRVKLCGFGEEMPVRVLADPHRKGAYSLSAAYSIEAAAFRARSVANRSA